MVSAIQIRQGDVLLQQISKLPLSCFESAVDPHRIVLAHGEVTGHAHAIYDHLFESPPEMNAAEDIAHQVIARAQSKARLMQTPGGDRYLEVIAPVTLRHEEHSKHVIPPGIYHLPRQVEYTSHGFDNVQD